MRLTSSVPPVEALFFRIIAFPIPTTIPPYMLASSLSSVSIGKSLKICSNISSNSESITVPNIAFAKNLFPSFKYAIINIGMFIINVVVPILKSNR